MRRSRSDGGFTLVELLVAVTALGIIMAPIAGGMFIGYRTMDETSNRLAGGQDAQLLSIYLPPDVQSATEATTAPAGCGGLTGTPKLQLTGASFNVVYALSTSSPWTLTRYVCTSGTAASPVVVARNIKDAQPDSLVVTITGTPFTKVAMKVTELASRTDPTSYVFTVTGRRRAA
jgi:prepilin-type N-terminal cleavage/methylation domain-containing protein